MGTTLREIVEEIGGGIPNGKKFKAAQTGGPSGGCIPAEHLDMPIDYDNLIAIGSMMGSGGLIVMDEDNCMVDIAKFFLEFTVDESCGKCTPCRVGTQASATRCSKRSPTGKGYHGRPRQDGGALLLHQGKLPVRSGSDSSQPGAYHTLRYFRDEYIAHVKDKRCPAGVCQGSAAHTDHRPCKCKRLYACAPEAVLSAQSSGTVKEPHMHRSQQSASSAAPVWRSASFGAIVKK